MDGLEGGWFLVEDVTRFSCPDGVSLPPAAVRISPRMANMPARWSRTDGVRAVIRAPTSSTVLRRVSAAEVPLKAIWALLRSPTND